MKQCLNVTGTNKSMIHNHGTFCDENCEACHGKIVVVKAPSTKIEKEH